MIKISHLTKIYKNNNQKVLDDITISFPDSGLFYIVGKSGCGKSTLINIIGLIDEEFQGEVIVNNKSLKELTDEEKSDYRFTTSSFIFQSYQADDKETVKENLLKALAITSLSKKEKNDLIKEKLSEVNLLEKENELFKNLSGGEKKRISLVRGLLKESKILLVDEPLSSINSALRIQITKLLEKESKHKLVIIITHEKEEIPDSAFIYHLINGKLYLKHEGVNTIAKTSLAKYERKQFKGSSFIFQLISILKSKREFLTITIFALMIGLFAISFSFQLSFSISKAIESTLTNYMSDNSLVISSSDQNYSATSFLTPSHNIAESIKSTFPDEVIDTATFYTTSMNTYFNGNQKTTILNNKKYFEITDLSLDSFLNYRMLDEINDVNIYGKSTTSISEIILGIDETNLVNLYYILFNENITSINDSELEIIGSYLTSHTIQLRIQANKNDWGYQQDYSFKINGIIKDEYCYIANSSNTFSNYFVTDVMHFKEIIEEEDINSKTPWTLKYQEGIRLYSNKLESFLDKFLKHSSFNDYTLKLFKDLNYIQDDLTTHNHIVILKDYLPKIKLSEINKFISANSYNLYSTNYSSPVYTYTANGYISGFAKPFFFSKYKEKLNKIQDDLYYSTENLGSFQSTLVEDIDGVIKADLVSAMNNNSLSFSSLTKSSLKVDYGVAPSSVNEIGISSNLAKKLFSNISHALNQTINTLVLNDTVKTNGKYQNSFISGELTITGIYENENDCIYQDSLFPLFYLFSLGGLKDDEFRVQQVILEVDIKNKDLNNYIIEIKNYGDYTGSFPMYNMIQEIKNTLNTLSKLFLGFSILSILAASSLLFISLYLIIRKDKKEIGILLTLGYYKKEIQHFYFALSFTVSFIGYLMSLFISIVVQITLEKTLTSILNSYSFSILPFFISFISCFFLTILVNSIISKSLKNISPKQALEKKF